MPSTIALPENPLGWHDPLAAAGFGPFLEDTRPAGLPDYLFFGELPAAYRWKGHVLRRWLRVLRFDVVDMTVGKRHRRDPETRLNLRGLLAIRGRDNTPAILAARFADRDEADHVALIDAAIGDQDPAALAEALAHLDHGPDELGCRPDCSWRPQTP
ncbi:hypothetical protein [Amycolatopsis sp. NPDC054798]